MTDVNTKKTLEEAIEIFLLLRDHPQDSDLRARKDAFLNRGKAERDAYQKVLSGWEVTGQSTKARAKPGPLKGALVAAILVGALYFAAEPLRVRMLADVRSGAEPEQTHLASGDLVDVDAATALIDLTDPTARGAEILRGSAYFQVQPSQTPFTVAVDDLEVRVLGTAFEVSQLGDDTSVSVYEGKVSVQKDREEWLLEPGDRLIWSARNGGTIDTVMPDAIAPWRRDRITADGMSFEQVVEIIDRRLPGKIVVTDSQIRASRIVGVFDLANPQSALKTLAAIHDLRVISATPFLTILTR